MLSKDDFKSLADDFTAIARKRGYDNDFIKNFLAQLLMNTYRDNPETLSETFRAEIQQSLTSIETKKPAEKKESAISIHARKTKDIKAETSKVGKKLRDKNALPALFGKAGGEITTGYNKKKKKKEVKAIVNLSFDMEELKKRGFNVPALEFFTPFEFDVLTHAISMYSAGNEYASMAQVWRQMNVGSDKELTHKMRAKLIKAFDLLGCTRITINTTQEVEAGLNSRRRYSGVLLPNEILEEEIITINGEECHDVIHFFRNSPLYDYSEDKCQISNFEVAMLAIPGLNGTEQNILLTHYLARFYVEERNGHRSKKRGEKKNSSYTMLYSPIYEYLGANLNNRTITARIREATRTILSAWVEKGFIKGFQELTKDNQPPKPREKAAKIKVELYTFEELKALIE